MFNYTVTWGSFIAVVGGCVWKPSPLTKLQPHEQFSENDTRGRFDGTVIVNRGMYERPRPALNHDK